MIELEAFLAFIETHLLLAYLILFLGSFLETYILTCIFLSGQIVFIGGAILASAGVLDIVWVSILCIGGGILGDSTSFWTGRLFGKQLRERFLHRRNMFLTPLNFERAQDILLKRGKSAIFFARLLGPLSWIMPFIAGSLKIRYPTYLLYNIPGVIVGIGEFIALGYIFGRASLLIIPQIAGYVLLGALVIFASVQIVLIWKNRTALAR